MGAIIMRRHLFYLGRRTLPRLISSPPIRWLHRGVPVRRVAEWEPQLASQTQTPPPKAEEERRQTPPLRVSATYIGRPVDIVKLQQLIYDTWDHEKFDLKADRDWIIVFLAPEEYYRDVQGQVDRASTNVYLSVSRRGSLVYVNATCKSPSYNIEGIVSQATSSDIPKDSQRATEDMQVDIDESMEEWSNFSQGRLKMRKLDIDNIRIINSCMAQTVNLAFYEGQVDKMYEIVGALNQQLEEQSVRISSRELYRHLGENNTISNNVMLSGLRNTVRPGSTAWKEERYSELQGLLWEEFDLEDRYDELQRKLSYINDSIKYSLDMLRDNKSIFLERMIVFLISAELGISCINAEIPERLWHWLLYWAT